MYNARICYYLLTETEHDADPDDGLAGEPEEHHPAEGDEHGEHEAEQHHPPVLGEVRQQPLSPALNVNGLHEIRDALLEVVAVHVGPVRAHHPLHLPSGGISGPAEAKGRDTAAEERLARYEVGGTLPQLDERLDRAGGELPATEVAAEVVQVVLLAHGVGPVGGGALLDAHLGRGASPDSGGDLDAASEVEKEEVRLILVVAAAADLALGVARIDQLEGVTVGKCVYCYDYPYQDKYHQQHETKHVGA